MLTRMLKDIVKKPAAREAAVPEGNAAKDDARPWLLGLVTAMFELIHHHEPDNFDASRYRNIPPNAFFYDQHAAYFLYVVEHVEQFFAARQLLADEASRELFDRLVLFRMLGHLHVRLPFNTPHNRAQAAAAEKFWTRDTADSGQFGPLAIYTLPGCEQELRIKGWKENVMWTFLYRQYFFGRNGVSIAPSPGDHVIDGGGCFGDTAINFADHVGPTGHVYAFDPLPRHCAIMREQLAMNPALAPRITVFPSGLSDATNDIAPLPPDDVINPGARVVPDAMPLTRLDDVVATSGIPRIDFIKLDIEGSELAALQGGEALIRRFKPKLAVSLYHRPRDFFSIPIWIHALDVGYRLYLDHYTIHQEETVLYATTG